MATIHNTGKHKIDSFANGLYYTIEDTQHGISCMLQGDDAVELETHLQSIDNVSMNSAHRDRMIDIMCDQYTDAMMEID